MELGRGPPDCHSSCNRTVAQWLSRVREASGKKQPIMSNDLIVETLSRVASAMLLWALIGLQDLKSFASELHRWFVTP